MYANRYAMNVSGDADKLTLNILETCICGTGKQYLDEQKSLEDFKNELTPSQQIQKSPYRRIVKILLTKFTGV